MACRRILAAAVLCVAAGACENAGSPAGVWGVRSADDRAAEKDGKAAIRKAEPFDIQIEGSDFQWHIRYPGPDGQLGTADDVIALRHPHLPANTAVRLNLTSADYVYLFAIPQFRLKEIAVPDRTYTLLVDPLAAGAYEFRGEQLCGFSHPNLSGSLFVESPRDFEAWLKTLSRTTNANRKPEHADAK